MGHAVEGAQLVVGEAVVLAAEDDAHLALLGEAGQLGHGQLGPHQLLLPDAVLAGGAHDPVQVRQGGLQVGEDLCPPHHLGPAARHALGAGQVQRVHQPYL
jgi:hypothetical protein